MLEVQAGEEKQYAAMEADTDKTQEAVAAAVFEVQVRTRCTRM